MRHIQEGFDFKNKEMTDPIDLAYIFRTGDNVLESWINDIGGEPVMDVRGRPDPELSKKMGADVEGHMVRSGRHTFPIRVLDEEDEERQLSQSTSTSKDDSDDGSNADAFVMVEGSGSKGSSDRGRHSGQVQTQGATEYDE